MKTTKFTGFWTIVMSLLSLLGAAPVHAFEYAAPMGDITHMPLSMVQKPFVLRFSQEELLKQPIWSKKVDAILISNGAEPVVRLAARTLRDALVSAQFGDAFIMEVDPSFAELPKNLQHRHLIVLGRPDDFAFMKAISNRERLTVTEQALNSDGFIVKPVREGTNHLLLITSCASRGVLYGAYEVEERTTHRGVPAIDQPFVPAVRNRSWSFWNFNEEPPDIIGRSRYNLSIHYFADWGSVLVYPEFPELGGDRNRELRREKQNAVHQMLAQAVKYGATPGLIFNPFTFTSSPSHYTEGRAVFAKAYPEMIAKPSGPFGTDLSHPKANIHTLNRFNLCPSDPATRRFVESGVREMVRTFPELGLLGVMFSDEGGDVICGCDRCKNWPYLDRIADYSKLIVEVARQENPKMRFMPFVHGINWWIALHQPEYEGRQEEALVELYRRTSNDYEGMMMQRSTPPGGDLQSWLYPKSTMLGKGVPLFLYIHSYEAGGPGIVSPVSGVMSHLSWPLPVYLDHLQTFLKPGNNMTGGASLVAGMEVAWWHPDLDPHHYMRNWNLAKFGPVAGEAAYQAMVNTHKITESFLLETKQDASESFTLYRWRAENFLQPYEGDMTLLKTVALDGVTNAIQLALYDFMVPQARQPQALQSVRPDQRVSWQKKFDIEEAIAIAERAEIQMSKALAEKPFSPDIQRLYQAAAASKSLTQLFRHYHLALLDANLARNSTGDREKQRYARESRQHLKDAIHHVVAYARQMLDVTGSDHRPKLARFRLDVERLYVGTSLCMVREAAYLFDREFGGESLTSFYDEVVAPKTDQTPPSTAR